MNTSSDALPNSLPPSQITSVEVPWTRRLYWSLRRELWENRSIYVAPMAAGAVVLLGFLASMIALPHRLRALSPTDVVKFRETLEQPYQLASALIMVTAFIVGVFYCLEALHSERRDRSILFWKSLPVSDLTSVLAKASVPLVVLPLIAFAILIVTQSIMLLLNTAVLAASGIGAAVLWSLPLFQRSLMMLYHIVTVHGLWYAPLYAWLLLVSAWARRAAILWAFLPPLAIGVIEKLAFNTTYFANFMEYRLMGASAGADPFVAPGSVSINLLAQLTPGRFLSSPGLWLGFAAAAIFLAAAVRLRRQRGPI